MRGKELRGKGKVNSRGEGSDKLNIDIDPEKKEPRSDTGVENAHEKSHCLTLYSRRGRFGVCNERRRGGARKKRKDLRQGGASLEEVE